MNDRSPLRKKLVRLSYLEGACFAIMVGFAESYLLVAAVRNGLSGTALGLATQLPILLGSCLALILPLVIRFDQIRVGLLLTVVSQILGLSCILASSFMDYPHWLVLVALVLYWMGGMSSGPLWLDWVSGWFPKGKFRGFLSKRNAFVLFVTLLSFVSASFFFPFFENQIVFQWIFALGLLARMVSFVLFYFHPKPLHRGQQESSENSARSEERADNSWKLLLFSKPLLIGGLLIFLMHFAVGFSAPFFITYKLNELGLSNQDYVLLTAIPLLSRSAVLWIFSVGQVRFYPPLMMGISIFGISSLPILYASFSSVSGLMIPELIGGIFWATFELSLSLFVLNRVTQNPRLIFGILTAADGIGLLCGGLIGGRLLELGYQHHEQFALGSLLRFVVALMFWMALMRVKDSRPSYAQYGEFLSSVLSLRPSMGSVRRLIPLWPRAPKDNKKSSD